MRQRPFRPGFDHTVEAPPDAVMGAVARLIEDDGAHVTGRFVHGHMQLTVPEQERHFWSPWLHLEVEPHRSEADRAGEPERSYVRGFFTPHPSLWTWFMLTYVALGTLAFFSGMWGVIQWQLDKPPDVLWVTLATGLAAAGLFWFSRIGRRLAADQMDILHDEVESALSSYGTVFQGAGP